MRVDIHRRVDVLVTKNLLHYLWVHLRLDLQIRTQRVTKIMKSKPKRVVFHFLDPDLNCGGAKIIFDEHVPRSRNPALHLVAWKDPVIWTGVNGLLMPRFEHVCKQTMAGDTRPRTLRLRVTDSMLRVPRATNIDLLVRIVDVLPLEPKRFRDSKTGHRDEQRQGLLQLRQLMKHFKDLLRSYENWFIIGSCRALHPRNWITFLPAGNLVLRLGEPVNPAHYGSQLV